VPFVSDKQRKYLYANKPNVAKKLAKKHKSKKMPKGYKQGGILGSQGY